MSLTVLYTDSRAPELDVEREIIRPDAVLINARKASLDEVDPEAIAGCDAMVVNRLRVDAAAVARLKRSRMVVRNGVGYDILDVEALGRAGIAACNVPDYGTTEVSDSAIAMMLAFARGTLTYDNALRADLKSGWSHAHNVTSRRLRGACFGLVGMGRIGTASALRAKAFGMQVAFHDPGLPNGAELALGVARARTLTELLGMADVVCIHAELTRENRGMIDAAAVAAMKPGAYVINTARGPICDTAALLAGLKSGRLAAVGLDVLPKEPAGLDDPLVAAWHADEPWIRGRVILGPHAAFYSPDAFSDLRRKCAQTVIDYLRDGRLTNCVNAEYLVNRR
ncbi:MAG: C-terminal binding protein [Burkholderiales bacterium]|nr:C-terminal binding protein [Burkholderiales bacterium]